LYFIVVLKPGDPHGLEHYPLAPEPEIPVYGVCRSELFRQRFPKDKIHHEVESNHRFALAPRLLIYYYDYMKPILKRAVPVVFSLLLLLSSCSARISGTLKEGGSADIELETGLEPRMTALIRSFRALAGGAGSAELILDGKVIGRSMEKAPGIASVTLNNTGPAALEGEIGIGRVGDFLSVGEKKFIVYTENPPGESPRISRSHLVIYLDLDTAPDVISLLSADAVDYLSALMAPAATGEALTRRAYLDLVTSFYGKPIADEISAARIRAVFEFPSVITAIQGGTASGRRAEFDVPLLDLLVLDRPLRYEVTW
jgi:hypothetical protein